MKNVYKFIVALIASYGAGFLGSFFTMSEIGTWYSLIEKPFFNPPNWVFGPVWSVLYFMIAVSLFLFWKREVRGEHQREIFGLFIFQLILNALWSIVFFGFHSPEIAMVIIFVLVLNIGLLIKQLWRQYRASAYLLIPYLLWVSFATILNIAIVYLN